MIAVFLLQLLEGIFENCFHFLSEMVYRVTQDDKYFRVVDYYYFPIPFSPCPNNLQFFKTPISILLFLLHLYYLKHSLTPTNSKVI